MSFALPVIDLSTAVVGTTGTLSWANAAPQAGFAAYGGTPHLALYNESGCGLQLTLSTGEQFYLTAGGWQHFGLNPSCQSLDYTVVYTLNNPLVTSLLGVWYAPGEEVPAAPVLGNSPIGGSVTNNTANVLQGVGQQTNVTELDNTGTGGAMLVPATGNIQALSLAARDAGGVPVVCFTANYDGTVGMNTAHMSTVLTFNGDTLVGNTLPSLVRLVSNLAVTDTIQHTVTTWTSPNDGAKHVYRVSGYLLLNNGTSGNFVSVRVDYTGPDGAAYTNVLASSGAFASAAMIIFGGAVSQVNGSYALDSLTITVNPNTTISLGYRDPGNTPNDHITMVLERLS